MTPPAASSPKALPPVRTMAWTFSTMCIGCSRSVSRVAGAPPRTSTPPTAGVSQRMTVQPVPASRLVSCPTRMPGMSVMSSCMLLIPTCALLCFLDSSAEPVHCLSHAFMFVKYGGAGDEQVSPCFDDLGNSSVVNSTINFDVAVQVVLVDKLAHL